MLQLREKVHQVIEIEMNWEGAEALGVRVIGDRGQAGVGGGGGGGGRDGRRRSCEADSDHGNESE